uniref:Uncharacterized protein n=1 Tax=Ciona intestinalis TaxID=7719 RepID=F6QDD4_CIOIN
MRIEDLQTGIVFLLILIEIVENILEDRHEEVKVVIGIVMREHPNEERKRNLKKRIRKLRKKKSRMLKLKWYQHHLYKYPTENEQNLSLCKQYHCLLVCVNYC